ncbi:chloramphenicol acetyltransferase [Heyndrickxia shackletonii]|uniref:Chloramphenicol acetyltransferase n=1 Tax=Heyndrickxia shackletonii TaxID=157838 RepID=A0A0Q3TKD2_9BACI|nr:type A chloramphenicol O-acetyltransferase [Heyndrickxia shackletonii]KQL54440.1 chloramphenicol acetyltransferase [Heyndrickxia shackletonii]NEY99163.1 type A chloramphenicol O-acetyltransferase [Heyndrickxia shackletonii]
MKFHPIDRENWDRKIYFEHYLHQKCNYSISTNIDITMLLEQLRNKGLKLYPAFIYMVSKTVNSYKEFRTCFNEDGVLGYWDQMVPSYTIFHQDNKTFSSIWTDFNDEFPTFYNNYQIDLECYGDLKGLDTKENISENTFHISSIPWISFTGFNLNVHHDNDYLLPIITGGKYFYQKDKIWLPVSLQLHHAVCDGYHAGLFFMELQQLSYQSKEWLS